ncbi:MAG: FmdB family zinc ribbon protein [Candidatus Binatia bacterium]
MPIYEYSCQKCGVVEVTQRITEKALAKCPTCKSKVKKLISNTSFQLKGTGWYVTDYARKGQNGESKSDDGSKSSSSSDSKSDSKNDSKSESKSETKKSEIPSTSSEKSSSTTSTAST